MMLFGFFFVLGVVGFFSSTANLLALYRKGRAATGKTIATEAQEIGKNEQEAEEEVEEDEQQEMVQLLTALPGYATFDDIV